MSNIYCNIIIILDYKNSSRQRLNSLFEQRGIEYKYSLREKDIISAGNIINPENIVHLTPKRAVCYFLQPAQHLNSDKVAGGQEIIIKGLYYQVNKSNKRYQLTDKFGIYASVVGNKVYPLVREAIGKEKIALQKKNITRFSTETIGDEVHYWPIIKEIL